VALATYLVWRFCVKPKRSQMVPKVVIDPSGPVAVDEKYFAPPINQRASTHTVHSIASTVLTRASNIIQIAYIPGVTNRAQPTPSPTSLIPPVPPIPIFTRDSGSSGEQHFFTPRDLRDSTCSDLSSSGDRTSYARTSYAPRSSIASIAYGKNATVPAPAQKIIFSRPTVVSVKTRLSGGSRTALLPALDYDQYGRPESGQSTFSVGSTFLNNASAATQGRAEVVKLQSNLRKVQNANIEVDMSDIDDKSLGGEALSPDQYSSSAESSPIDPRGPFADPVERPTSLSDVIDGKSRRAIAREPSPVDDEHASTDP
jgi:hypothetical protein